MADLKCGTVLTSVRGMAGIDCKMDESTYSFCPLINNPIINYTDATCRHIAEAYVTLCESVGNSACDKSGSLFIDAYRVVNGKVPGE